MLVKNIRNLAIAICLVAFSGAATMAQQAKPFEPKEGQRGKDVIWLPTHTGLVNKMLDMAKVTPSDYLIDLGSGDGRTVITAAKRGVKAHGIEYNPDMVELSKHRAAQAGVTGRASFVKADIFESDFSKATVISMFLLPDLNIRLRPKLLELKPGTRIVSNSFDMDDWEPDQVTEIEDGCSEHCEAYLWIIPAKFSGIWKALDGEVRLEQKFQMVTGTVRNGNVVAPIRNGKITGSNISFVAGGVEYSAKLGPLGMVGKAKSKLGTKDWQAVLSPN